MARSVQKQIARLNQSIDQLRQQGRYEEALSLAWQAHDLALQSFGETSSSFADALSVLASLYWVTNDRVAAEPLLLQELQIWEQVDGSERLNAVIPLRHLGELASERGDYDRAKSFYQESVELLRVGLGERAQTEPYFAEQLTELGQVQHKMGGYEEAESTLREALEIRRKVLGAEHPDTAKSLNILAELYKELGRLPEAEAFLREALQIMRAAFGDESAHLEVFLNNLARLYSRAGDYSQAEPLLLQLLRIQQRSGNNDPSRYLQTLDILVGMYQQTGRYDEAEQLLQPSIAILRSAWGESHPDLADYLVNYASALQEMGRYSEVARPLRTALEIYRKAYGPDHPRVATCLNNLGYLYFLTGHYAEAERLYKEALEISKKDPGEDHPETTVLLTNLAEIYRLTGRAAQAEGLFKRVLSIRREGYGELHPLTLQAVNNLATCFSSLGRYAEAERMYGQALEFQRQVPGEDHFEVAVSLNNLGLLYITMGQYRIAENALQQALSIRRRLNPKHPDVADSLAGLAGLYEISGQYQLAEQLYQEALAIRRDALGTEHPAAAAIVAALGRILYYTGNIRGAVYTLERALEMRRDSLGEGHPDYARNLADLAYLYLKMGDGAKAESLALQALEIQRTILGEEHPDLFHGLNTLAVLYDRGGEDIKAENLYKQALIIIDRSLGEQHPSAGTLRFNLSVLYTKAGRVEEALELMQQNEMITDQLITQIFGMRSERQRLEYLATVQSSFHTFLSLVSGQLSHSAPAIRSALDLTLRRKALAAEALAAQRDEALAGSYPELAPKLEKLADLRRQIEQITLEGPGLEGPAALQPYFLAQWSEQRDQLEAELAGDIPEINLEERLHAASRQRIARALPQGSALIEFVAYNAVDFESAKTKSSSLWKPARYLAFIVVNEEPEDVQMVDLGESQPIDKMIVTFIGSLTNRGRSQVGRQIGEEEEIQDLTAISEVGDQLRAALFDPLVAKLGGRKRLFLAPDGDLSRLPFEVLPTTDNRHVIDDFQISYLSVGREVIRFGLQATGPKAPALVIADPDYDFQDTSAVMPEKEGLNTKQISRDLNRGGLRFNRLPGTRTEGIEVGRLLKVEPLLGRKALESVLKTCHSPQVLHLATHGFFLVDQLEDPGEGMPTQMIMSGAFGNLITRLSQLENPLLRSGLALAGVNTWASGGTLPVEAENGMLTAEDVSSLDLLRTDLVVLSACETGLGQIHRGEGVFGLRRTFVLAGARRLVMSLWKVPDQQTQILMIDFYRRIIDGQRCAEALRQAQLAMKAQGYNPYHWGAFIFQGDPGPMLSENQVDDSRMKENFG